MKLLGYYLDCDTAVCTNCAPAGFAVDDYRDWEGFENWDEPLPIWEESESDTPTHCSKCEDPIEHVLTPEGYHYVAEAVDGALRGHGRPQIVQLWAEAYPEAWEDFRRSLWAEQMLKAYIECALWSTTFEADEETGKPADHETGYQLAYDENYDEDDIADDSLEEMARECAQFVMYNIVDLVGMDPQQAGHDFWLTRNGHGAGFWDRGLGEKGDRLTKEAHVYGSVDLYIGDDGKVHAQ